MKRLVLMAMAGFVMVSCGGDNGSGGDEGIDAGPDLDSGGMVDDVAPMVVSVTPGDGATDTDTGVVVEVVFSESLNEATLTAAAFDIGPVPFDSLSYDDATYTVTLTGPWLPATTHSLTIAGVEDPAGNVAADFASTFRTLATQSMRIDGGGAASHSGAKVAYDSAGNGVATWRIQTRDTFQGGSLVGFSTYTKATDTWSAETVYGDMGAPVFVASNGTTFMLAGGGKTRLITYDDVNDAWSATGGTYSTIGLSSYSGLVSNGDTYMLFASGSTKAKQFNGTSWVTPVSAPWSSVRDFTIVSDGISYGAVWRENDDARFSLMRGNVWGAAQVADEPAVLDRVSKASLAPFVGGGGYVVAWTQNDAVGTSTDEVWARSYDTSNTALPATPTTAATVLGTANSTVASAPMASTNGNAVALAWETTGDVVTAAVSTDNAVFTATDLHTSTAFVDGVYLVQDGSRTAVGFVERNGADLTMSAFVYADATWGNLAAISPVTTSISDVSAAGVASAASPLGFAWIQGGQTIGSAAYDTAWAMDTHGAAQNGFGPPTMFATDAEVGVAWGEDAGLMIEVGNAATPIDLVSQVVEADVSGESVTVAKDGTRVAAWIQPVGHASQVHARVQGRSSWSDVTAISLPGELGTLRDVGTASAGGTAVVVWRDDSGAWARYYDGATWAAVTHLDAQGQKPRVVTHGDTFVVSWVRVTNSNAAIAPGLPSQGGSTSNDVYANTLTAGQWGTPAAITIAASSPGGLRLVNAGSTTLILWQAGSNMILAFFDGSAWSALSAVPLGGELEDDLAVTTSPGRFTVSWRVDMDLRALVIEGVSLGAPETVATGLGYGNYYVATSGDQAMAVWDRDNDSAWRYRLRTSAGWQTEGSLYPPDAAGSFVLAGGAAGFVVALRDYDLGKIVAMTFDGSAWQSAEIDDNTGANDFFPISTADGMAVVYPVYAVENEVGVSRYRDGSWQTPSKVAAGTDTFDGFRAAASAGDSVMCTWKEVALSAQLWGIVGL